MEWVESEQRVSLDFETGYTCRNIEMGWCNMISAYIPFGANELLWEGCTYGRNEFDDGERLEEINRNAGRERGERTEMR